MARKPARKRPRSVWLSHDLYSKYQPAARSMERRQRGVPRQDSMFFFTGYSPRARIRVNSALSPSSPFLRRLLTSYSQQDTLPGPKPATFEEGTTAKGTDHAKKPAAGPACNQKSDSTTAPDDAFSQKEGSLGSTEEEKTPPLRWRSQNRIKFAGGCQLLLLPSLFGILGLVGCRGPCGFLFCESLFAAL